MNAPTTPAVLGYGAADSPRPASWTDVLCLVLTLPAAAAIVVPLTYDVSPASVPFELGKFVLRRDWDLTVVTIALMAVPLFLPAPLFALRLRVIIWGTTTRRERMAGWVAAAIGALAVLAFLALFLARWEETGVAGRWACAMAVFVLGGTGLGLALARRRRVPAADVLTAALLAPYVAGSAMCLRAFIYDAQLGWYLTLISATAGLVELVIGAWRLCGRT
jgi:hypothetical protein